MLERLILLVYFGVAYAGLSPNSAQVKEIIEKYNDGRFSNNITEDATLDVPELVRKYGYPLEQHKVQTTDGYILEMHRIPYGRDKNNKPGRKTVVFLMHGLLSSSADFILMGPGSSLGYLLAEEGYDVWMGNARGNYYSRKHIKHNPDALFNVDFWDFSWDEIGNIDVAEMIDYALAHTGQSRLHYVGFSQGTTVFFVLASLRPEFNDKIISMHALAPVAYMANNKNLLFNALAPHANSLSTMLPVVIGHTPAGSSVRQFAHYGQGIAGKKFRRFNHGFLKNLQVYGRTSPPDYDLGKITVPVFLHYSDQDPLAHVKDVDRLWKELKNPIGKYRIRDDTFSHLDFLYGIDAKSYVFDRVINLIRAVN